MMISRSLKMPVLLATTIACTLCQSLNAEEKPAESAETQEVKVRDITLTIPKTWEEQTPSNKLRLAQFGIPMAKGDENPVQLTVFSFGGSSIQANVERWIKQFDSKDRKAKVTQGESPFGKYVFVDVSGSFNQPIGPPVLRKTKKVDDARMLAVILVVEKKGVYFLKMAGENKTISAAAADFRKSFGANAEKEKSLDGEKKEE